MVGRHQTHTPCRPALKAYTLTLLTTRTRSAHLGCAVVGRVCSWLVSRARLFAPSAATTGLRRVCLMALPAPSPQPQPQPQPPLIDLILEIDWHQWRRRCFSRLGFRTVRESSQTGGPNQPTNRLISLGARVLSERLSHYWSQRT